MKKRILTLLPILAVLLCLLTVTAAAACTVTFNANGSSGTMDNQTVDDGVDTALTANRFTRNEYTFTGWNTSADGSGDAYADCQTVTLTDSLTLYAQWEKQNNARWVFGAPDTEPDYTNASFGTLAEAFTAASSNTDDVNSVTYVQLLENVVSTVRFNLLSGKTMQLDLNSRSITVTSSSTAYGIYTEAGSKLTVKNGSVSTVSNGSGSSYGIYAIGSLTADSCTVTSTSSNNNCYGICSKDAVNITNCTVTSTGRYTSYGIYADAAVSVSGGSINASCTGNSSSYGVYALDNVTLNNSPCISAGKTDIFLDERGIKITLAGTLSGDFLPYTLDSYYTGVISSGAGACGITAQNVSDYFISSDDKEEIFVSGEGTAAELIYKEKIRVYFKVGGGSTVSTQYLARSDPKAARPEDPTYDGYTFDGWYADKDYTSAFDFSQALTENTDIFAKWSFTATAAQLEDTDDVYYGLYGSDLATLIQNSLSKIPIKVTGEDDAEANELYTNNWTVKAGFNLAAAQPGDTITFVGNIFAPTTTTYDYPSKGILPKWEGSFTVEADLILDYVVKVDSRRYITNPNGIMAYRYTSSSSPNFDIRGLYNGDWKQTTYSSDGYYTYIKADANGSSQTEMISAVPYADGGSTKLGLTVGIDFNFLNGGKTLQILYTVKNTTSDPITFSLGSGADIQIGEDDEAVITPFEHRTGYKMVSKKDSDFGAQFNFFASDYVGVTSVSDFWYGPYSSQDGDYYWSSRKDEAVFYGENECIESNGSSPFDSAGSWNWSNQTLAGDEETYFSVLIGIGGAGSEHAATVSGLTSPEGSVTLQLNEALTSSTQLVIKLGDTVLEEGADKDYTVDLSQPNTPIITFNSRSDLNVSSGDLTVTVTFDDNSTKDVTIKNKIPGTGNVSGEEGTLEDVSATGLEDLAIETGKDIVLIVKQEQPNNVNAEQIAASPDAAGKTIDFLDIVLKDKNATEPADALISDISTVLEIAIPFDFSGKRDIIVYRYHNNAVNVFGKLTAQPAAADRADGTFFVDEQNQKIYIYTCHFSTYGVGYTSIYTVTFDSRGGSPVDAQNVAGGDKAAAPAKPAKSGYSFDGWFKEADCTTAWDFNDAVTGNITLYAKWTAIPVVPESDVIIIHQPEHGNITYTPIENAIGDKITVIVTADEDCYVKEILVTNKHGEKIELTENSNGTYSFVRPKGMAVISAVILPCPKDSTCPISAFTDTDATAWYHDGVHFCLQYGLMIGTSDTAFDPDMDISRAMIAAILWRQAGEPKAESAQPFLDVKDGQWYTDAIAWAAENGIVKGYGNGNFGPDAPITREQLALMLWRYANSPAAVHTAAGFTDRVTISTWAADAVFWAAAQDIITDKNGVIDPKGTVSRAETAVILKRFLNKY